MLGCFIFPCFMAFTSFIWHNSVWGFCFFSLGGVEQRIGLFPVLYFYSPFFQFLDTLPKSPGQKHAYLSPLEVYFFQPRDPQLIPFALPFSVRCLLILPSLYTYTLVLSPPIPPAYLPTKHEFGGLNVFLLPFLSQNILLVSVTFAFAV